MATAVSICSNALSILGAKPINSFDDRGDHPRLCQNLYPSVRDTLLRSHPWNCATTREILAPLQKRPPFDFAYQFQLPGDWLRTLQVGRKGEAIPFRTERRVILADVTELPLVWVFRADEADWTTNLIHVIELAMAAKMAYAVTSSTSLRDSLRDEFMRELKAARAVDGQDDPPEEFDEGSFFESRFA
jgi:hypothetical protein